MKGEDKSHSEQAKQPLMNKNEVSYMVDYTNLIRIFETLNVTLSMITKELAATNKQHTELMEIMQTLNMNQAELMKGFKAVMDEECNCDECACEVENACPCC